VANTALSSAKVPVVDLVRLAGLRYITCIIMGHMPKLIQLTLRKAKNVDNNCYISRVVSKLNFISDNIIIIIYLYLYIKL
jgi:hypothetical protein